MEWKEKLPSGCPPSDCVVPDNITCYRLINGPKPKEEDFYPHMKLKPKQPYKGKECEANAVSLWSKRASINSPAKLPTLKHMTHFVELALNRQSGVVQYGRRNKDHISWWVEKNCDPLSLCGDVRKRENHE